MSPISGTTRDAVDTQLIGPDGTKFTLVDTAGIRRRTAVKDSPDGAEPLSVSRAIKAMRRSDVRPCCCAWVPLWAASVLCVLPASSAVSVDQMHGVVASLGKVCVLLVSCVSCLPAVLSMVTRCIRSQPAWHSEELAESYTCRCSSGRRPRSCCKRERERVKQSNENHLAWPQHHV